MIYVNIEAVKSEGRGLAGGNGWHATDDVVEAVAIELRRFHRTWEALGHGGIETYRITVATQAQPAPNEDQQISTSRIPRGGEVSYPALPIKLNDNYSCQGIDAEGESVVFDDLLNEGERVGLGPPIDGDASPPPTRPLCVVAMACGSIRYPPRTQHERPNS